MHPIPSRLPLSCLLPALLLAAVPALAVPSHAESAAPESVVRAEIRPGWVTAEGTRMIALHLTLAPGWKTYWRSPGDAGIPPLFDWQGSENLAGIALHWPRPEVFHLNGLRTIGYERDLVLPIELRPGDPAAPIRVSGTVDLGVCESVCVPATLAFDAVLSGPGKSDTTIHAALADRPVPAERARVGDVTCRFAPISDGLRLSVTIPMPRIGRAEVALIETADPGVWVSEPETRRDGGMLSVEADLVPPVGRPLAVDRSALRFTVIGDRQAVDIRGCSAG